MAEWTFSYPDDDERAKNSKALGSRFSYGWLHKMFVAAFPGFTPVFALWDYGNDLVLTMPKIRGYLLLERGISRSGGESKVSLNRQENKAKIAMKAIKDIRDAVKEFHATH